MEIRAEACGSSSHVKAEREDSFRVNGAIFLNSSSCISRSILFGNCLPRRFCTQTVIFGYHKLGSPSPGALGKSNFVSPELLKKQLRRMIQRGATPGQFDAIADPESTDRGKFAITFDDGYASLFESGLAVLRECRVRALTYIVTGQLGGSNVWDQQRGDVVYPLMSESHIRTWLQEGHTIGSHTLSHPDLTSLPEEVARQEIRQSKDRLEQLFGIPIHHFSYPYGSWNRKVRDWVRGAGYRTAVTVDQRPISASDNSWSLPRWMVYTHPWPWLANLRERLRSNLRKAPPHAPVTEAADE
jgi:peptidoglycan/xylan/chitin deacetylase (PgdA/CDA1 family)